MRDNKVSDVQIGKSWACKNDNFQIFVVWSKKYLNAELYFSKS